MATSRHRGTELNNVRETWEQNERESGMTPVSNTGSEGLERTIQEEAAEYDRNSSEERLLGGDRASVSDAEGEE
ncbi:hypothetical protein [Flaviaesturariibacter amylovorans]|uniref:Uncharacterized protein n=1 Tax=Flaviaesturariibacter amylovorans TaxID=1084520 RepID=A0ABP8HE50_9BACT